MNDLDERIIEIEEKLGFSSNQIHNAMAIIFDKSYAETQIDKIEYSVLQDKNIQELCFEYIELIQ